MTEPLDRVSKYNIPRPPSLPKSVSLGFFYEKDWATYAKRYGARAIDKGFEVRFMNPRDPEGKWDKDQWPIEYRLGHPGELPEWHPLIEKWGLQILEKAGFLNFEAESNTYMTPIGRLARWRNPSQVEEQRIHPVFRRDMWWEITDEQWDLIEPAIHLASALLDDPTVLNLMYAIVTDTKQSVWDSGLGWCKVLTVPDTLTAQQQLLVYEKVVDMRKHTCWYFESQLDTGTLGRTFELDEPATGPLTCKSEIDLDPIWYEALRDFHDQALSKNTNHQDFLEGLLDLAGVPDKEKPSKIDLSSAIMRTNFRLADTLVHEFTHALSMAYFDKPKVKPRPQCEPFLPGNRYNELGCAMTNYIFGGVPEPMTCYMPPMSPLENARQHMYIPFGNFFPDKWDKWTRPKEDDPDVKETGSEKDLSEPITFYPIPQQYVKEMTDSDTWLKGVPKYGLEYLKMPKLHEWAVQLLPVSGTTGFWGTGHDRWRDDDNTIKPKSWK